MSITGHAHHFLSRLDRLSVPHLELALSLYRDPGLVRVILNRAEVPEGAERVALSLAHLERGPFLVVTRDGKFVTCLGEGMNAKNVFVVSRTKVDAATERVRLIRELGSMPEEPGAFAKLLRAMKDRAQWLSREQFQSVAMWQPLLRQEFAQWLARTHEHVDTVQQILLRELKRAKRLHAVFDEALHSYWQNIWLVGHLSVLAAMDGAEGFDFLSDEVRSSFFDERFSTLTVAFGLTGNALRGLWGVARIGKPLLSAYKRACDEATNLLDFVDGGFGLALLGLRHSKLRAEVKKAMAPGAARGSAHHGLVAMRELLVKIIEREEQEPECSYVSYGQLGAHLAMQFGRRLPATSPFHFQERGAVPPDIARRTLLYDPDHFLSERQTVMVMALSLPWLARTSAEDLYLSGEYVDAVRTPYDPERALEALRDERDRERAAQLAQAKQAGPSRSGPCPCGSGKKYKRCCGAEKK